MAKRKNIPRSELPLAVEVIGDVAGEDDDTELLADDGQQILPSDLPLNNGPLPAPAVDPLDLPAGPTFDAAPADDTQVTASLPIAANLPESQWPAHIDIRLTVEQSTTLRRLAAALDRQGARLANGQRVTTLGQSVRYLLEAVTPELAIQS